MAVGISLATPIGIAIDVLLYDIVPSTTKIIGVVVLLLGYFLLNLSYAGYEFGPVYYLCKPRLPKNGTEEEATDLSDSLHDTI